eukprot:4545302-Pyramimonas_sp.AAC.1
MNMPKTEVIAVATARGSRRLNKDIGARSTEAMCDGRPLHPQGAAQYLELQISATGRSGAAAVAR